MRRQLLPLLLVTALLASCGDDPEATAPPTGPTDTSGATITSTTAATTFPPDAAPPTAASSITTTAPTTTTSEPSAATTTTALDAVDWTAPGFPASLPLESIPWDAVGEGWLLVRYQMATEGRKEEVGPEALFLIDPDYRVYAIAMWPDPGVRILAWSPEGRRILTFDGMLQVIDLSSGLATPIPGALPAGDGIRIDARFTRPTGRDVVVRVLDWDDHVTLRCLHTDGTLFSEFADLDLSATEYSDPDYLPFGITWLYAPAGTEVVVATSDGIRLLSNQGSTIRRLDTPGRGCRLSRWWGEASVLAACHDRDWAASSCWYTGPGPGGRSLWAVPLDGGPATRLTPAPICAAGTWAPDYGDGLGSGPVVAAQTDGCCDCGGSVSFFSSGIERPWDGIPESQHPCSPDLIALSTSGGFLIVDTIFDWTPDHGTTGHLPTILEVAADGRVVAEVLPVLPGYWGGVSQVLTTEEAAG